MVQTDLLREGAVAIASSLRARCFGTAQPLSTYDKCVLSNLRDYPSCTGLLACFSSDETGWKDLGCQTLALGVENGSSVTTTPLLIYGTQGSRVLTAAEDVEGWIEKTKNFLIHDTHLTQAIKRPDPTITAPEYRSTMDAFRDLPELDPFKGFASEALNPLVAMPTHKESYKYVGDFTAPPVNARGNVKKQRTVNRIGTSCGLHYFGDDKAQVMLTAAARYAGPKKQFILDEEGKTLARAIAQNMFDKIIDKERLRDAWNDLAMSDVYKGWLGKAAAAGYAATHTLANEDSDRILRFQGKSGFKPKESFPDKVSIHKAPQGIMAWSKGAVSFFGAACRSIADVVRRSLNDSTTWNNGLSIEEAAVRFSTAAQKVQTNMNVRLDAVEMDSKQNEFTHHIVASFLKLLCVSDEFTELYFSMMEDFEVTNPELKMFLKWVKASGEPFTLFGNSFLMTAMTLWLIEGEGDFALFTQGDDVDLNQANMSLNEDKLANVALYCDFVMSCDWGDYAAFCGYVYKNGLLCPNIRRKLIKLLGMSSPSVKHFQEVQDSIRVWCSDLKSHIGFSDILDLNATTYGVSRDTITNWFDCIESLGHVSAAQYLSVVTSVPLNFNYLNGHGFLESVY